MVDAPAVPLSSIRDVFVSGGGGKCMYPFVDNVKDDHAASSSMKTEERPDAPRGGAMTKRDIQTIRLRASELMCGNNNDDNINDCCGRFVRSTNLLTADDGKSSTVVRIITSCDEDDIEGGASMRHITPQVEEDAMSDDDDDYDASNPPLQPHLT